MSRIIKPWVIVLTGIVFNISSAVVTHYFIGLNNELVADLDRMISNKQILIDGLWQSKIENERKKEFFILYFSSRQPDSTASPELINRYFQEYLLETAKIYEFKDFENQLADMKSGNIELMLELSDKIETFVIDSINNSYFEKIEHEDSKKPIEQRNSTLFSIAIFLQVIGLILILARDFKGFRF